MQAIDITGKRFESLVVLERVANDSSGNAKWKCLCDCGKVIEVSGNHLRTGHTKSCGCYKIQKTKEVNTKHGDCNSRLYRVWSHMLSRCADTHGKNSKWYQEKGITVCKEWHSYTVFKEWALATGYDETAAYGVCTIDRIDTTKGYNPKNCRWVTAKVQARNRSTNKMIAYRGRVQSLAAWCEELRIPYTVVQSRLYRGWSIEKAFNTVVIKRR